MSVWYCSKNKLCFNALYTFMLAYSMNCFHCDDGRLMQKKHILMQICSTYIYAWFKVMVFLMSYAVGSSIESFIPKLKCWLYCCCISALYQTMDISQQWHCVAAIAVYAIIVQESCIVIVAKILRFYRMLEFCLDVSCVICVPSMCNDCSVLWPCLCGANQYICFTACWYYCWCEVLVIVYVV